MLTFVGQVESSGQGGGHFALVPSDITAGFTEKRPAVRALINGTEYRTRVAVYGGKTYLGLRKDLLKAIGAAVGDEIVVELTLDTEERVIEVPEVLTAALAADPNLAAAYSKLAPSHRQEYAQWIAEAKKPETAATRITRMAARLLKS